MPEKLRPSLNKLTFKYISKVKYFKISAEIELDGIERKWTQPTVIISAWKG
jgi:hypothetical protein